MLTAAGIIVLGFVLYALGRQGLRKQGLAERGSPKMKKDYTPFVSIIIPSHSDEKAIYRCVESAKMLDYPKKEIVVVDDSEKDPSRICRSLGAKCFHSKKRMGKPGALNFGIHRTHGEILLLLDVDTVVPRDLLKKTLSWFLDKDVAAVMPNYTVSSRKYLSRLVEIENRLTIALVRMTLFFGGMIGYRGCCVLLRRSVVQKLGGIPDTLMEDNHFSATIAQKGYKIRFAHETTVLTDEPYKTESLRKQKTRWGKGALFTFLHHRKFYLSSPGFILYFLPYMLLGIIISLVFTWNFIFNPLYLPVFIGSIILAGILHVYILLLDDRKPSLPDALRFLFIYLPMTNYFYARGLYEGMKEKKKGSKELVPEKW